VDQLLFDDRTGTVLRVQPREKTRQVSGIIPEAKQNGLKT
jgi:hypothetical protein